MYLEAPRHDPPLITTDGPTDGDEPPLSFLNLIELRFLASWREHAPLPAIREGIAYAAEELGAERPLLELDFKRYGRELFIRYGEHLINPTRRGQLAWPDAASDLLESLDYKDDAAYRWWPLGRQAPVAINTRVNGGRPTTATTGVRTVAIATRAKEGWTVAEIAADTSASAEEIRAAAQVEAVTLAA